MPSPSNNIASPAIQRDNHLVGFKALFTVYVDAQILPVAFEQDRHPLIIRVFLPSVSKINVAKKNFTDLW